MRDRYVLSRDELIAEIAILEKRKAEIVSMEGARYVELRVRSLDEQIARRGEQLAELNRAYGLKPLPE